MAELRRRAGMRRRRRICTSLRAANPVGSGAGSTTSGIRTAPGARRLWTARNRCRPVRGLATTLPSSRVRGRQLTEILRDASCPDEMARGSCRLGSSVVRSPRATLNASLIRRRDQDQPVSGNPVLSCIWSAVICQCLFLHGPGPLHVRVIAKLLGRHRSHLRRPASRHRSRKAHT